MSVFAIADLHLSLSCDKPMDVFGGWDNYITRLENNWKKIVNNNDTVVIPGDISWGIKLEETLDDFKFLEKLPGRKLILKGNHDLWWNTVKKINEFFEKNEIYSIKTVFNSSQTAEKFAVCGSRGWSKDSGDNDEKIILREAGRLDRSICAAKQTGLIPLVFLHYPPVLTNYECIPITGVLKKHGIKTVYHGHLHGAAIRGAVPEVDGIKYKLVSADALGFTPFLIV